LTGVNAVDAVPSNAAFDEPEVTMRLSRSVAGTLVALLLCGVVASACGSSSASPGAGSSTTTTAAASAGNPPTLSTLTSAVQAQLTGTGASDFSVTGINELTCTLPAKWADSATFQCRAYDFANDLMGEYDGTVQPASKGVPQWNGTWSPK
jgi:ABC-type transport system substrate-binding protein